ncbi:MAG: major facilitator superfamily protein [Sphingomonas bacterium]|nr:MFS transporter [Sphingomonas bacterium]MDB5690434.1 major facilitator superfamily protein [Sphingomonas bacterium]
MHDAGPSPASAGLAADAAPSGMAPGERRTRPGWALFLLAAISTCGFIDRIVMNVLVEPIKNEFALTDLQIGLVAGLAFAVLNVVLGLWVARIAERRRRLTLISIGTLLWSIATAVCGFAGSFVQLVFARIGVGVGEAVGLPATSSVISDFFPRNKRATAMSVLMLAPPLGAFLGSAGGALIAQAYGWRAAFLFAAMPGFLLAILVWLTVGEPRRGHYDGLAANAAEVPPFSAVLRRIADRRSLRHLFAGSTIASVVGFGLNAFLAAFLLRRFGYGVAQAGVIAGLIASLPASFSVVGSGWLADRIGRRDPRAYGYIPGIALLLSAPLYMLAVTRESAGASIALLAVAAVFQYAYLGTTSGVFQNMMHPRMRASATAVTSLVSSLVGGGFGPILVGGLSDRFSAGTVGPGGGLAMAMAVVSIGYAWGACHYLWATRTLTRELALPI